VILRQTFGGTRRPHVERMMYDTQRLEKRRHFRSDFGRPIEGRDVKLIALAFGQTLNMSATDNPTSIAFIVDGDSREI
jgi:hypothetical protein